MNQSTNTIKDPIYILIGSIIRSKTKTLKKIMNRLVTKILTKANFINSLEHQKDVLVHFNSSVRSYKFESDYNLSFHYKEYLKKK